jgi:hypothetical protein
LTVARRAIAAVRSVIERCWNKDPAARCEAVELLALLQQCQARFERARAQWDALCG